MERVKGGMREEEAFCAHRQEGRGAESREGGFFFDMRT